MANLSPYNIDKIVFILLTFLKAFPPVWGMHNLLPSTVICFSFRFGCTDCSLYTKNLFDWEFIYFSLWTNYYFVIESINVFYFVNNGVCVCVCMWEGTGEEGNKDQMWDGSKGDDMRTIFCSTSAFTKYASYTYGIE